MKKYTIYTLSDPLTTEVRYVGQTTRTLHKRREQHISGDHTKKEVTPKMSWIKEMRKEGRHPTIEYLDQVEGSREDAFMLENYWINQLLSWGMDLVNVTSYFLPGKNTTRAQIGVCQYSLEGELIAEYPSGSEASRRTGIDGTQIGMCCQGKSKSGGGYFWKYSKTGLVKKAALKIVPGTKLFHQYGPDGTYLQEWTKVGDAALTIGALSNGISSVLSGKKRSCRGYFFHWDKLPHYTPIPDSHLKEVHQYTKEGVLVKTWESATHAANTLGLNPSGIRNAALSFSKSSQGFHWTHTLIKQPHESNPY